MKTLELQRKWDLTSREVEALRRTLGGVFGVARHQIVRDHRSRILRVEQLEDWELVHNLVVNEGINRCLSNYLAAGTQITAWKVALWKTNTAVAAGHTYAVPVNTEVGGADVDETVRAAWTPGAVAAGSVSNTAAPAVYIGDGAFTAYGCALVGGGSAAATLTDTAGGGVMHSSVLFASSKAMDVDVQLSITYPQTNADDGV